LLVLQSPEQQAALPVPACVHGLPSVRHFVLSGVHLPLPQVPLQQSPLPEHASLSAMQLVWQTLPSQLTEQQSVFAEHDAPACEQVDEFASHVFAVGSHSIEQQSLLPVHACPNVTHG
jgi:hypothetical protein